MATKRVSNSDPRVAEEQIPEGWASAPIGSLCRLVNGRAFKPSEWTTTGLPIIRIQNLNNPDAKFNHYSGPFDRRHAVKHGDLLFAWSGTPGTSFGAHIWKGGPAVLNQHIFRVALPEELLDKEYLRLAINQRLDDLIDAAHGGAGLAHVTKGVVEFTELRIAPHAEQLRIAPLLGRLLSTLESCGNRLEHVPAILSRFRQTVLAAACSGRLTEEWRVTATTRPAEEILRELDEVPMGTHGRRSAAAIIEPDEGAETGSLPKGWKHVALARLTASLDYGTSAKSQPTGKVPVLRMGNIQEGRLDWTGLVYTSDDREIARYALVPGTVLFNRTNSPELVGKTAIYRGERPSIFAGYLIRIQALPALDPEYLTLCLNSTAARSFCLRVKTDGVSQSNINATKLGAFAVPFCDIIEQREIVRRVERLLQTAEQIGTKVSAARARLEKLRSSVLARAFRGELLPTEAELAVQEGRSYESAEELLARIQRTLEHSGDTPKSEPHPPAARRRPMTAKTRDGQRGAKR